MEALAKRFFIWLIGVALFVAAFDLTDWLFHKDSYSFSAEDSIFIPVIAYFTASVIMWIFRGIGKSAKKRAAKAKKE